MISALRASKAARAAPVRGWPEMWPWGMVEERVGGRPRLEWVRRGEVRGIGVGVGVGVGEAGGGEGGVVMVGVGVGVGSQCVWKCG